MSRAPELSAEPVDAPLHVIVGIIVDSDGRVLIAERPAGKHMAGQWEFPGGKLRSDESPFDGLRRELDEELGVVIESAEAFCELSHRYPDRSVFLDVWWVREFSGEARALEGQRLRWVEPERLKAVPMLPADAPIVAAIRDRLA